MNQSDIVIDNTYLVTKIVKKTNAKMFKNVRVGDILHFSLVLKYLGGNYGSTYATYITIKNVGKHEEVRKSMNQLSGLLDNFEFERWS